MHSERTPGEIAHSQNVREMFGGIAGRYDLLNHILSLNIDKRWRRLVADELREILNDANATVLDVACGTGDLSLELNRNAKAQIVGTDFCRPMLSVAKEKTVATNARIPYLEADAMTLPFADEAFDAVTIAFGLRNLPNYENGLRELNRVLKPSGTLAVLECSHPPLPVFRQIYGFYFNKVLPRIGGLVSGSGAAYRYLPNSVSTFPEQQALVALMEQTGFTSVKYQNLTGGIAAIHIGIRAETRV
ncbi:MAG: bifunctional demethylmenaquinone methyltransferase/2-methoxy-6-polyprenyl-1,4-benzoquinol methylase UbiE [Pyrinomonadaceae bacterium]